MSSVRRNGHFDSMIQGSSVVHHFLQVIHSLFSTTCFEKGTAAHWSSI